MPKVKCVCDQTISYSEIPNPNEWLMISDHHFDRFSGKVDTEDIYRAMLPILKCPECGRLLVYWDGWNQPPAIYKREPA